MGLGLRSYCIVGGNAVSAFLSWRLQATNACDVTLVWKSGFEQVSQYGITFKLVHRDAFSKIKLTHVTGRNFLATNASNPDTVWILLCPKPSYPWPDPL